MTIGTQGLDLIKRQVAGICDYYQSRMNAEFPPMKDEIGRIAA